MGMNNAMGMGVGMGGGMGGFTQTQQPTFNRNSSQGLNQKM